MLEFLSRWLGGGNPTADWAASAAAPMVADLDTNALGGVGLGEPFDGLRFLGKGRWRKLPAMLGGRKGVLMGTLEYPERGLALDVVGDRLDGFVLSVSGDAEHGLAPFGGRIRLHGAEMGADRLSTEKRCLDMLGEPYWRAEDEDEVLLFYERGRVEWQVEATKAGAVTALLVVSPPLMEDPEQRAAYGVTKPWPPAPAIPTQREE